MKRLLRRILCVITAAACFLGVLPLSGFAATVPAPTDEVTVDGVLKLLKTYNHDVYDFVSSEVNSDSQGETFLFWWYSDKAIIANLDTAVHETFHGYTHFDPFRNWNVNWNDTEMRLTELIYGGNGKVYEVDYNDEEMFKGSTD